MGAADSPARKQPQPTDRSPLSVISNQALPSEAPIAESATSSTTGASSTLSDVPKSKSKKKTKKKLNLDAGQERLLRCYFGLREYAGDYLTPADAARVDISISSLDLFSNDVSDGGPRFIEPVSWADMNAFVQRSRPWEDRTLLPLEGEERPENREGFVWVEDFMFHEAGFMLSALESFGRTQPDPDTWDCEWFSNAWKDSRGSTRWSPLPLISPTDYRLWLLHSVIEPTDSSTPHVQVLLQSKVPLQDDTLTTGEMIIATAVLATRRYFEGKTYNHHRYVPATIFSACCRQLRLLQVWHDKEQPLAVHVRQSRMFDFTEGYEANYRDWITFVCWLMGSPICQPASSQVAPTVCSPGGGATAGASEGDKSESARSGSSHSDSHQSDDSPGDSLHRSETAGASQC